MRLASRATRSLALTALLSALAGCGTTATAPTSAFALDAGNYTLKLSGGGTSGGAVPNACSTFGAGIREGNVPVIVTRSGSDWSARPSIAPVPGWSMTFTTTGAAAGTATGSIGGAAVDTTADVAITVTTSVIDGRNSGTNIAGGAIQGAINFAASGGSAACTLGTWTLTPR